MMLFVIAPGSLAKVGDHMFDAKKVADMAITKAAEAMLKAATDVKRDMGSQGFGIQIKPKASPSRQGDKVSFADISFPDEQTKTEFERRYRQRLK